MPRRLPAEVDADLVGAMQRSVLLVFVLTRVHELMARSAEEVSATQIELHDAATARVSVDDARTTRVRVAAAEPARDALNRHRLDDLVTRLVGNAYR